MSSYGSRSVLQPPTNKATTSKGATAAPKMATPSRPRGADDSRSGGGAPRGGGGGGAAPRAELASASYSFSSVSFPMLPTSDIVECLREMGVEGVTEDEIKDPGRHRERVKQIFLRILSDCQGVGEADLVMPAAAAALKASGASSSSSSSHGLPDDLHTKAWSTIAYVKNLQKFLERCGCPDFGLRDVLRPEKARFLRQLCAIIAFAKFQRTLLPDFHALRETRDGLNENIAHVERAILVRSAEEADLVSQQDLVAEAHEECQRACAELENEMKRVTLVNSKLRAELEQLNRTKAMLKDDVEGAELSVQECAAELHKWTSRLVQSPERKKQGIAHKTQLLEVIKAEVHEMEHQWNAAKDAKHRRHDVCQKLDALHLDAVMDVATATEQATQNNREGRAKVLASEQQALQGATNVTQAEREYQRQADHRTSERKRLELRLEAAQESHDTVLDQLLRLEKDRRDAMARTEQGEREVAALSAQLDDEKRRADDAVRHMVRQYRVQARAWKSRHEWQMQELGIVGGHE